MIPRRRPDRVLIQVYQRVYYGVTRPVVRSYKRLPWVTRRTISIGVQLYMVLYIFLTVPLRVAFYYDTRSHSETHEWTQELTVFVALDCIADFIGVTQFARFYDLWRTVFYELSTFASLRSTKDRTRTSDTDRVSASKMVVRRLSSANNFQLGRVNWTISSIKPLSAMPGDKGSRSSSQHHYSNAELVLEVIALLPVEVIPVVLGSFNTLHLVRITKLCRLYRLRSCLTRLAKLYSDRDLVQYLSSAGIDSLVRTIALCAGLCHWVACGYMLIAHVQCGTDLAECDANIESSWVVRDRLHGASVGRKYARTLYWASRTLVLLGYDDVTPVSNAETLYVVIVTIMGALFGTSMLANFLFLFRFRNARYAAYAHHVDNAREYMRLQNIPRSVRQQVTAYFNYAWSTHHCLDSEEALHLLPQHLQSKVIATLRANRTAQVCFLMKESVEFINELALALARRIYSPGDQIIEPKVNAQMFFVIRGQVILASLGGGKPNECKTGDHFAEMCLLFPEVYLQRAFAKTFCELYVLTKAKFDEALSEYHRGTEHATRLRMAESLEKYQLQLRKTKKILGLQDGYENLSGRSSLGRFSTGRLSAVKSRSSQGKSSTGKSLTSIGRGSPGHGPMPVGAQWKQRTHWRLPGSPFRLGWDTVRLMAIVYVAFEVPYFAVFISMTEGRHMFVVDTGMDLRYVVTMLVEFFSLSTLSSARDFRVHGPHCYAVHRSVGSDLRSVQIQRILSRSARLAPCGRYFGFYYDRFSTSSLVNFPTSSFAATAIVAGFTTRTQRFVRCELKVSYRLNFSFGRHAHAAYCRLCMVRDGPLPTRQPIRPWR